MTGPGRPGWENTNLEPLKPSKRFWSRVITNIPFTILGNTVHPASLSVESALGLTAAPLLYFILFYWLFGGHIGHLLVGGRVRDARTGGRISFWQAVVRTSYDLAPLGVALLVFWTIPIDAEIGSGALDGVIEVGSALVISIPMGFMVLVRESDHRHLFDLLSKTVVVDRATVQQMSGDTTPQRSWLAEAGKNLVAGVAAIAVLVGLALLAGFGWSVSTPAGEGEGESESAPAIQRVLVPAPTPVATAIPTLAARSMPSRFQPGEREYVHALIKEVMAEAIADRGEAPPTGDEYMVVCEALRKHRWDPSSFYADPDATTRLGMIVGGMDGMFAEMDKLRLERQWAAYTLNDFCADIQPASGQRGSGIGPSVSLSAATPSPGAALIASLAQITTPQPEPTAAPMPTPLPTDTPAPTPTPLPTDTPAPTPTPTVTPIPTATQTPTATPRPTPTPTPRPTATPRPTPTPTATPEEQRTQWRAYLLDLVNGSRQAAGLSAVTLGNNEAAQKHAESMLKHGHIGHIGHWGLDGLTPVMRYTLAGGTNYVHENASGVIGVRDVDWGPRYGQQSWRMSLEKVHKGLLNSPGHRKTILNKWHKKVSLGIACNKYTCSVAQNFEGDYVVFTKPPSISGAGVLTLAGRFKGGFTLSDMQVWYHQPPHTLTLGQLDATSSYGVGQEPATFIIEPAPPGYYYSESNLLPESYTWLRGVDPYSVNPKAPRDSSAASGIPRIIIPRETKQKSVPWTIADRWQIPVSSFDVKADIRKVIRDIGPGVYIIVMWGVNGEEYLSLTNYAIFVD